MNKLQKKVLLFLIAQIKGEPVAETGWIPLTLAERRWLSLTLRSRGLKGEKNGRFNIRDLVSLAEYWLTEGSA